MTFLSYDEMRSLLNLKYLRDGDKITTPLVSVETYSNQQFVDHKVITISDFFKVSKDPAFLFFGTGEKQKLSLIESLPLFEKMYDVIYDFYVDRAKDDKHYKQKIINMTFLWFYKYFNVSRLTGLGIVWLIMGFISLLVLAIILVELHILGIVISFIFILLFDTRYKKSKSILYLLLMPLLGLFYFPIRLIDYAINKK